MEDNFERSGVVYYIDPGKMIARQIRRRIETIDEQIRETEDDIRLLRKTEASLEEIERTLHKMKALAVAAADSTEPARTHLEKQFQLLRQKIDRIIADSGDQGINLLDGTYGSIDRIISALGASLSDAP